jgi:hypothetical protein
VACLLTLLSTIDSSGLELFGEDFEEAFFVESPDHYVKDHALVRGHDGTFHIFYIVGIAGEGWNDPGNEVDFGHATSSDLRHWSVRSRVLPIDPAHGWKSRNVWAPHVIPDPRAPGGFLMAYTGVDSLVNQAIGIATSSDLDSWIDLSVTQPAYRPDTTWALWDGTSGWANCRDPYLLDLGTGIILLSTVRTRDGYGGQPSLGAVALAHSLDGRDWMDSGAPLVVNNSASLMESSHLTQNPEGPSWHLFYTRTIEPGGVHVLTNDNALAGWQMDSDRSLDGGGIASEWSAETTYSGVVNYHTQLGAWTHGVRFDSLAWGPAGPDLVRRSRFWTRWSLVAGDLIQMPTLFDRPGTRTGQPSAMQGRFWVNTAEAYAGPYAGGCANCGPQEALTGVLRSIPFILSGDRIELLVGGSASSLAYVALVDAATGAILRRSSGIGSDALIRHTWDVSALYGLEVAIEITDLDPAGHVSVDDIQELSPTAPVPELDLARTELLHIAPNPAATGVGIRYPRSGSVAPRITIYDPSGRLVRHLYAPVREEITRLEWDGRSNTGGRVPSGTYYIKLEDGATGRQETARVVILR